VAILTAVQLSGRDIQCGYVIMVDWFHKLHWVFSGLNTALNQERKKET
jgi:hypothetical protein